MSQLSYLIITVELKFQTVQLWKKKNFHMKYICKSFIEKMTIYVGKSRMKDQHFWGDQFSEKGIVTMTSSTKLLKSQFAAFALGASIAIAFDPILYRSIAIVSIAPSIYSSANMVFLLFCKYLFATSDNKILQLLRHTLYLILSNWTISLVNELIH